MAPIRRPSAGTALLSLALGGAVLADTVAAHVGGLSGSGATGEIPTWLTVVTGGIVVGASFLFTSLLTDHEAIRAVNGWGVAASLPESFRTAAGIGLRSASVVALALVVLLGLVGPQAPRRNFALLVVWVGWWAAYTMSVYAVGNSWPDLNPWRALATALPGRGERTYPERLGAWPSVVGLLGFVWIEVVSPVADDARLLVTIVGVYSLVTIGGAALYGAETWFGTVDPISRVFRCYGRLAPLQRTERGIALTLPTTTLTDSRVSDEPGGTAFVVALLWVTTYDGLVATPGWAAAIGPLVELGVPPLLVYLGAILGGFGLFYAVYDFASRKVRRSADSYVSADYIRRYFAPSLLPIAAGYHVAHFLGYFLGLSPALAAVLRSPLDPASQAAVLAMPAWFGTLQLLLVLGGHLLAVWVAHSLSVELFPGILKPIRSQYPFVVVMIGYTMTSVWIIAQPFSAPPYT